MTHWGWYWEYRNQKPRRGLCSWRSLNEIDSFEMFKFREGLEWVRNSADKLLFEIFSPYQLKAFFLDNVLRMQKGDGSIYLIPIETKTCNYGGFYHFFRCPLCNIRMRKLYCIKGQYQCRKCANLSYFSQRLRPSMRNRDNATKIEKYLEKYGGNTSKKPLYMKTNTFRRLKKRCTDYEKKASQFADKELLQWYGSKMEEWLKDEYDYMLRSEFYDVYDWKEPQN